MYFLKHRLLFKIQSCYCVHFWTNTFEKGMKPPYSPSYQLNNTTIVILKDGFGIK